MLSQSYPSAPLWRRLAALFYDALLMIALCLFISFLVVAINGGNAMTQTQTPFVQTMMLFAVFSFFAGFWLHGGQTLGMKAWHIKLVNQTEQPIRLLQCLLRFFMALISIACLGLGYWWMLWDKQQLTWHDKYSMTRIILLKKIPEKSPGTFQ